MLTAGLLLSKGYFPKELPPPFTSANFAQVVKHNNSSLKAALQKSQNHTKNGTHNLARPHSLRRKLGIPNPISFSQLCFVLEQYWPQIQVHISKSPLAICLPQVRPNHFRALYRDKRQSIEPVRRSEIRATSRYILKTDLSNFYRSIYTHSIPWALHTKAVAKLMRKRNQLFGNEIDYWVRCCQDGQTMGIPIGPDTSPIIAETILSFLDQELPKSICDSGYRYLDDYEFGFKSRAKAEATLARLQSILNEFELEINDSKTDIIELPEPLEEKWASELRIIKIRSTPASQRYDLYYYFSLAFEYFRQKNKDYVLRYAISKLNSIVIHKSNWDVYQNLLLQCMLSEPGCMPFVFDQVLKYEKSGYSMSYYLLEEAFNEIIDVHAPLGHGSEVAWAVWGTILFKTKIHTKTTDLIVNMDDSVVALLALDAYKDGFLDPSADFSTWSNSMSTQDLYESQWLLCYEAGIKGWLPSLGGSDHISGEHTFNLLRSLGISFYDSGVANTLRNQAPQVAYYTRVSY